MRPNAALFAPNANGPDGSNGFRQQLRHLFRYKLTFGFIQCLPLAMSIRANGQLCKMSFVVAGLWSISPALALGFQNRGSALQDC